MNNDVYILCIHNTKVSLGIDWLWSSEKNIGELSSAHGTAPSIGKTVTKRLTDQSLRFGCVTHMSHMKRTCNLTVNRTRCDFFSLPDILCMLRSTFQESLCSERFTIL